MKKNRVTGQASSDAFSLATPTATAIAAGYKALHQATQLLVAGLQEKAAEAATKKALCNIPNRLGYQLFPRNPSTVSKRLLGLPLALPIATKPLAETMEQMVEKSEFNIGFLKRNSPPEVIEACYKSLSAKAKAEVPFTVIDIYLLALIGFAVDCLRKMPRCSFCPRFAAFETPFCREHSQSKLAPGTVAEKAARYRSGKVIVKHYDYYFTREPSFVDISERNVSAYIARLLWLKPLPDEERTSKAIKDQIAASPRLIDMIGADFEKLHGLRFYKRLQEKIDPIEVRPRVWRWKLERLRLWYQYEQVLREQKKNALPRYWLKLLEARRQEKLGFKKSRIAEILGVSAATISSWMCRSGTKSLSAAVEFHLAHMPRRTPLTPSGLRKLPISHHRDR